MAEGGATRRAGASPGGGHAWATRPSGCTSSRTTRAGAVTVIRIASGSPGRTRGGVPAGWPSSVSPTEAPEPFGGSAASRSRVACESERGADRVAAGTARLSILARYTCWATTATTSVAAMVRRSATVAGRRSQVRNRSPRVRLLELGQDVLARLGVGQQLAQAFLLGEGVEQSLIREGCSQ